MDRDKENLWKEYIRLNYKSPAWIVADNGASKALKQFDAGKRRKLKLKPVKKGGK